METIVVKTDNAANARRLVDLLKNIRYVKSVDLNGSPAPLTDADWVRPGRPATDEELEKLAKEMEADEGEYTSEEVLEYAKKGITEWRERNR